LAIRAPSYCTVSLRDSFYEQSLLCTDAFGFSSCHVGRLRLAKLAFVPTRFTPSVFCIDGTDRVLGGDDIGDIHVKEATWAPTYFSLNMSQVLGPGKMVV
jgi:hypothetical protein